MQMRGRGSENFVDKCGKSLPTYLIGMTAKASDSVFSIFHATSAAEFALLKTAHSADSSWRFRDPSRHLGQRTRQHLEHRLPAAASASVALRHSVHGSSLLLGGLKPGPMTRFHSKRSSSNGLNIKRKSTQVTQLRRRCNNFCFNQNAAIPNTPCGDNAVSSAEFVPRNTVRKAIIPLVVVDVVVF